MSEGLILAYSAALGFAASGMVSSLVQLLTKQPVGFNPPSGGAGSYLLAALSFAVTGPYIVARAALKSLTGERKAWGVAGGGAVVAGLWSVCSGLVVLSVVLSLTGA